jgi:hypothetical protein
MALLVPVWSAVGPGAAGAALAAATYAGIFLATALVEQLADLPKAEVDALIRAMTRGEANAFEYAESDG